MVLHFSKGLIPVSRTITSLLTWITKMYVCLEAQHGLNLTFVGWRNTQLYDNVCPSFSDLQTDSEDVLELRDKSDFNTSFPKMSFCFISAKQSGNFYVNLIMIVDCEKQKHYEPGLHMLTGDLCVRHHNNNGTVISKLFLHLASFVRF